MARSPDGRRWYQTINLNQSYGARLMCGMPVGRRLMSHYPHWRYNKRAQRALGRSPEEKVKGHSGANNREPQGHNLNNFGRAPFDDVIY